MFRDLRISLLIAASLIRSLNAAEDLPITIDECFADELVGGCIDPVSGTFLERAVDMVIPSSGGLSVERNHNSHRSVPSTHVLADFSPRWPSTVLELFGFWSWNHKTAAYYHYGITYAVNNAGHVILYKPGVVKNVGKIHDDNFKRWTNCHHGRIAARFDLHNTKMKRESRQSHWEIVEPSGLKHIYNGERDKPKVREFVNIDVEAERIFPSGLRYLYDHQGVLNLKKISSVNRNQKSVAQIKSVDVEASRIFELQASTGDWVRYTLGGGVGYFVPLKVESSQQPTVEYAYERFHDKYHLCREQLCKISLPEGRYRRIAYFNRKDIGGFFAKARPEDYSKVKAYYAPGADDREVALYQLEYKDECTTVKDALNQKKIYHFNEDKRIQSIEAYDAVGRLAYSRHMKWSSEPVEGRLQAYWLQDKEGCIPTFKQCEYDQRGNVIKEKTWTKLTPQASYPVLDDKGELKNKQAINAYEVLHTYSQDDFNLLTETLYPNGRRDQYLYEPDTDRRVAHLVWWNGTLCERHLWTYDAFAEIAYEINDDGCSSDLQSLEGVHKRTFKRFARHQDGPHIGLVEYEEGGYLDIESKQEVILYRTEYTYSSKRRVSSKKITDLSTNRVYESIYEFDEKGNLTGEVTPRGVRIARGYDANNNLTWQSGPMPHVQLSFSYDRNNQLKEKKTIYPDSTWVEKYLYDDLGQLIAKTDPYNIRQEYVYDAQGRMIEKRTLGMLDSDLKLSTAPLVETMQYDLLGNLTTYSDARGFSKQYEYNGIGHLLYEKHPDGKTIQYLYDAKGCLAQKIYDDLWSELFVYDSENRLVEVYRLEGSTRSLIQQNVYSGCLLTHRIDALGHEDAYGYDGAGRQIWHERRDGSTGRTSREEWSYDAFDNVLLHRRWQNDTDYIEEIKKYDAEGLLAEKFHRNQLGEIQGHEIYVRNEVGLLLETRHIDQETLSTDFFQRDTHGQIVCRVNQLGEKTHYKRQYLMPGLSGVLGTVVEELRATQDRLWTWEDSLGRPVELKLFDADNQLIQHKYLGYDASGHLVFRLEECLAKGVSTARPVVTRLEYGANDLILKRWDAFGSDQPRYREWVYDTSGRCRVKHEPGQSHFYTYDAQGRILRSWSSDGTIDYTYSYDLLGHPLSVKSALTSGETLRSYDAWDQVISETLETGACYQRAFDGLGQVIEETYSDGSKVNRDYVGGHLRAVHREGPFAYTHTLESYDSQGRALKESMPFDLGKICRHYDSMGRVLLLDRPGYRASDVAYDTRGRLISRKIEQGGLQRLENYRYDALDQLEKEEGLANHTYVHDSRQRRLAKDDVRTQVDSLDQIESMSASSSDFVYDLDGRLCSFRKEGSLWELGYDAWSRLTHLKNDLLEVFYTYDAYDRCLTRRLRQNEVDRLQQYGYIDRRLVTIESEGQTQQRTFVRGDGSEQGDTMAWEVEGQVRLPILDLTGSTVGWMSSSGALLASWSFDSFGVPQSERLGPWGYCSKFHDADLDLVYFSKRYYIPSWGRWLTRDPKGEIDGSNLYAYVGNNPLTRTDSWGLMIENYDDFGISFGLEFTPYGGVSDPLGELACPYGPNAGDKDFEGMKLERLGDGTFKISYTESDRKTWGSNNFAYIPGSCNDLKDAIRNANYMAHETKSDVYFSVFPSYGKVDLVLALCEKQGWLNVPERNARIVKETIEAATKDGCNAHLFPHSRGLHPVREANERYGELNHDMFQQTYVHGVAGDWDVLKGNHFADVKNTVCTKDLVVRTFDNGAIERQRECGMLIEVEPFIKEGESSGGSIEHSFTCPTNQASLREYLKTIGDNFR